MSKENCYLPLHNQRIARRWRSSRTCGLLCHYTRSSVNYKKKKIKRSWFRKWFTDYKDQIGKKNALSSLRHHFVTLSYVTNAHESYGGVYHHLVLFWGTYHKSLIYGNRIQCKKNILFFYPQLLSKITEGNKNDPTFDYLSLILSNRLFICLCEAKTKRPLAENFNNLVTIQISSYEIDSWLKAYIS